MTKVIKEGRGLINKLIDRLPFEAHLPGYHFCGPGTKLKTRLDRGDEGINPLDRACKEHDIIYHKYPDSNKRSEADRILAEKAWHRVLAKDSSPSEKAFAWAVTNAMKAKGKLGAGLMMKNNLKYGRKKELNNTDSLKREKNQKKTKSLKFRNIIDAARVNDVSSLNKASRLALTKAKRFLKKYGDIPRSPRILPIPKTGGFLPLLVPIMAGLSAIGSLAGGASAIAKAVNEAKDAKERLEEMKRHNLKMEDQKIGSGLYLKPYRKGYGLYLKEKGF